MVGDGKMASDPTAVSGHLAAAPEGFRPQYEPSKLSCSNRPIGLSLAKPSSAAVASQRSRTLPIVLAAPAKQAV